MNTAVDQQLDDSQRAMALFKPGLINRVAVAVAKEALASDSAFWADDVDTSGVEPGDRNSIGHAFRNLSKIGLIKRLEGDDDHRRSKKPGSHGRTVFKYAVLDRRLLRLLLKRNGAEPVTGQKELFDKK